MELSVQVHAAAGAGALLLGAGVLAREPARSRNRLFALLCLCLATWHLGVAGRLANLPLGASFPWHLIYLFGSCMAAPLALHFAIALTRASSRTRRLLLPPAYAISAILWLAALGRGPAATMAWNGPAIVLLGAILAATLGVLVRRVRALPAGAERAALRLLLAGGAIAIVGGLTDFIPRHGSGWSRAGPLATLLMLTIVCAVIARHRFLDVGGFLARAIGLLLGASVATVLIVFVAQVSAPRVVPLLFAVLLVLALAGPVGRALLSGARAYVADEEGALLAAFGEVSRALEAVTRMEEVWEAMDRGFAPLHSRLSMSVSLLQETGASASASAAGAAARREYRVVHASSAASSGPALPETCALARLLAAERGVLTRRILEDEAYEGSPAIVPLAAAALDEWKPLGVGAVAPLMRGESLVGWAALGGRASESAVTARVATAFLAVARQAVASLERAEAVDAAKRREALAAVGEMAAGLAHEVRNPLAAIHGAAQALGSGVNGERAREMLRVIEEESDRLGGFVGEFLDYARPASPRREAVDLAETARRALRACEAAGTSVRTEIVARPGTPRALGDPEQLVRVFENLVRNAREAAGPAGSLRVEIDADGAGGVVARFEDDGPGIAPGQASRLFEPFYTTKPRGTGLGLALLHRIIEAHGGAVRAESRPAGGAVFTVRLPAADPGSLEAAESGPRTGERM